MINRFWDSVWIPECVKVLYGAGGWLLTEVWAPDVLRNPPDPSPYPSGEEGYDRTTSMLQKRSVVVTLLRVYVDSAVFTHRHDQGMWSLLEQRAEEDKARRNLSCLAGSKLATNKSPKNWGICQQIQHHFLIGETESSKWNKLPDDFWGIKHGAFSSGIPVTMKGLNIHKLHHTFLFPSCFSVSMSWRPSLGLGTTTGSTVPSVW